MGRVHDARTPRVPRAFLLLATFVLFAAAVRAQSPGTGGIRGRVTDGAGAPIDGAVITVTNEATALARTARTDAGGRYVISELPITGTYHLTATHGGSTSEERKGLQLRGGQSAVVDVVLAPSTMSEAITVYGTAAGVESGTPQLGDRFDAARIAETPLLGRKLTSLPLLDSAVRSARGTGDLFLDQTLFVVNGAGRRQTTFTIDGAAADDAWGRQTIFTDVPLSAVEEMTVLTNSFSAELGRSAGASINLVTRGGTNEVRGEALALVRPGGLQAETPVTHQDASDELKQGSLFLSGPLVRDRAYWSIAGQESKQDRDSVITSAVQPGIYTGHGTQDLLFARADAELAASNHLLARFDLDHLEDTNPQDVVGGITLPSAGRTFRRDTESAELADSAVLSSNAINEARLSYLHGDPITEFEPHQASVQLVRPGVSTEGESRFAHLTARETRAADTLSFAGGEHFLRAGGDWARARSGGDSQEFGSPFVLGQFTFKPGIPASTPTSQLTINDVTRFTQGFGNLRYSVEDTLWSAFAQDDWRLRRDLVLNLGVRYERQSLTGDTNNVSPRVGAEWNPGADPKTVVRGSWGLYYTQLPDNFQATWALGGPTGFFNFSAAPGQLGFPTSLQPLPAFPPGAVLPPRDVTLRPGMASYYGQFLPVSKLEGYPSELQNPQTNQVTLGASREVASGWFLSADGVHATTTKITRNLDLNAPSLFVRTAPGQTRSGSAADATRPIAPTPNGYRRILVTVNDGTAKYDGLQLNLHKSFASSGDFHLSYTWSHARNDIEPDAPGGDPNDAHLLGKEWADSLLDQRHRGVANGWIGVPLGLRLGGLFEYATGRPFNITTGVDNNGDGANTDRPVIDGHVIGRNAGRGRDLYELTLFVEREFALPTGAIGLRAEVYNVTNHENVVGYNGVYGNDPSGQPLPTFGQPLGGLANVEPGREWQLLARYRF